MKKKEPSRFVLKVKKLTMILCIVLAVLYACTAMAEESVKIRLPDGLYMYDSHVIKKTGEKDSVTFQKYFVVQNNIIYSSKDAIKKFGISKLDKLFGKDKKYKIILGDEKIGEIDDVKIKERHREEIIFVQDIKEGPAYGKKTISLSRLGSALRCLAVPEAYKEVRKKVYTTIPQEEVDRIAKLAKGKLFPLVKNIEALKRCKILETELVSEKMSLLDKISVRNNEMYIGFYKYAFRSRDKALGMCDFTALFSARDDNVNAITINYEYEMASLSEGEINICGMLDIDGCGADELIIEKQFGGEAGLTINLEIYKQKADGKWMQIKKIEN